MSICGERVTEIFCFFNGYLNLDIAIYSLRAKTKQILAVVTLNNFIASKCEAIQKNKVLSLLLGDCRPSSEIPSPLFDSFSVFTVILWLDHRIYLNF